MGSCFNSLAVFRRSLTPYAPPKLPHRAGIDVKFTQCRSLTFHVYHFCAPLNLARCFFANAVAGLNWRLDTLNVWICDRYVWSGTAEVCLCWRSVVWHAASTLRVSLWTCWSAVKFPPCKRKLTLSLLRQTYQARSSQSPTFMSEVYQFSSRLSQLDFSLRMKVFSPANSWNHS